MRSLLDRLLRRLRDTHGFTITEVSMASALAMIVMAGAFALLDSGTRHERGQEARHTALVELRSAGDRITKDLRQARSIHSMSTTTHLAVETFVSGVERAVTYDLDVANKTLLRRECASLSSSGTCTSASAIPVVTEAKTVGTTPVFCYNWNSATNTCVQLTPPPASQLAAIRVTISRAPEINPGQPVMIATDIDLRNI
jgi:hypothetical protein